MGSKKLPEFSLSIVFILGALLKSTVGIENFDVADLAKARGEFPSDPTTTAPSTTCHLVWKVTATSPSTRSRTPGTVDHGVIMDAIHHTMMDYEYRQMWMSLMKHDYQLFLSELKSRGHKTFIRPKFPKKQKYDTTFEGELGERRWEFLINYFKNMDLPTFERILELFDYERHKYEQITFSTFSSPPLPSGYWEMTDPNYWKTFSDKHNFTVGKGESIDPAFWTQFTNEDGNTRFGHKTEAQWKYFTEEDDNIMADPWRYTVVRDQWEKMRTINPRMFTDM